MVNDFRAIVQSYWEGKTEVLGGKHYRVWVVVDWRNMEQWLNDTDGETEVMGEK
jgi:hypothetical protein